ncbi:MAG: hypothetical protein HQL69_23325, partial [Magnetococcales bacterium]|nr:hypothetical protein [Magnetococcales bacterium]
FLSTINNIAKEKEIIINTLSPVNDQPLKYKLTFVADYYSFISFVYKLESLDIILEGIKIHPYKIENNIPIHDISFTIIPRNDASPMLVKQKYIDFDVEVDNKNIRNPFQHFVYFGEQELTKTDVNLSMEYKLTGIGIGVDGKKEATIDNKLYRIGDELDGKTIKTIKKNTVIMEKTIKDSVPKKYIITFRYKNEKKTDKN